jgi:glycine cleavage system H protein
MTPNDRRFTGTHEWVKVEGDIATVGITDHAQDSLGDITFIELPAPGSIVSKGKECGVIESVKAAGDIYSPLDGEVVENNADTQSAPEVINESPYDKGWLFKLKSFDQSAVDALMDSAAYEKFLREND